MCKGRLIVKSSGINSDTQRKQYVMFEEISKVDDHHKVQSNLENKVPQEPVDQVPLEESNNDIS